ncbi:DUF6660 family protein [Pseudobacter ginsenosidimutans]|uniref:Uncharacterized protein n=1 Tax=Pseudobacter ginsenosidimutans TaxID=661488 RepID=A0A4Q7MUW5_9BACT|nr:DUF6660 family protein [Pseudobacter ginsenosidimutans]QEC40582.1 hypothetical protein FSB84_02290 [Pseudobacter ginsenosidimutans]RZS72702.1 hypothetical protein EV199_4625 [Pseudobacter ginsenosidimutans]
MRLIGYIVAVLVVLLGFVPCADTVNTATAQASAVEQSDEHEHGEYCSPFCHCSCCTTISIPHQVQEISLAVESFSRPNASPYTASVLEVSIPVWQPPQLA